jgi:hypothetical protein
LGKKEVNLWIPDSFTGEDLIMKKNIFLVLAIIFIVIVMMGTAVYSWSQQNMKRQKDETFWIESGGIQEINDKNYQADGRIVLLTGTGEDEGENLSQPEIKIMVEEIDNGSGKQPHYVILVDLNTEYIGSQNWKVKIVNEEEKYPPKFKITEGQIDCKITSSESGLLFRTVKRKIDGRIYCIESSSEGAAGTIYTQYTYSTIKNGSLTAVSCVIRYPQCMNYSEPYRTECANERETFDLDKIIGYIVKNLSVKNAE